MITGQERTLDQIRRHYDVERSLAQRLRCATALERKTLYTALYDELLRRVPDHPMLVRKSSAEQSARTVTDKMRQLQPFLRRDSTFLELGPGDCSLAFEVAKVCKKVYGVDVSHEMTRTSKKPENFELIISDGSSVPVPPNSVDLAYSNQLMEHLHPDDAREQLRNVFTALAPGGTYVCVTPNRLNGPHDVSKWFDVIATGFHLKEYTLAEIVRLFRDVGFSNIRKLARKSGKYRVIPMWPGQALESGLRLLPHSARRALASRKTIKEAIIIRVVAQKRLAADAPVRPSGA